MLIDWPGAISFELALATVQPQSDVTDSILTACPEKFSSV
jgi:hypothetical protein